MDKQKLSDAVYIAKGIGISLVVIGHFYFKDYQPDLWIKIRKIIYLYHMPLFMFLSGFLYAQKGPNISSATDYTQLLIKKIRRLMLPYLSLSLLVALLKMVFQQIANLGQPIDSQFYLYLLFNPESYLTESGGYARFLWFLYTLFVIFCIFPVLERIFKNHIYILIFMLLLNCFEFPVYFCINHAVHYLPHFTLGAIIYNYFVKSGDIRSPRIITIYIFSVLLLLLTPFPFFIDSKSFLIKYLIGFSGSIFILFSFYSFIRWKEGKFFFTLRKIGMYSATIYLFHFIFMSPIIVLIYCLFDTPDTLFIPMLLLVYSFGVIIPIVIEKYLLSKSNILLSLFLGK